MRKFLILIILLGGGWAAFEYVIKPNFKLDLGQAEACRGNLSQIGKLLVERIPGRRLEDLDGPDHLLQVIEDMDPKIPKLFACPGDKAWTSGDCSFRGPDWAAAQDAINEKLIKRPLIIACCACGEDGDQPWHEKGVSVLYDSFDAGFVPWAEMEGYQDGPVTIGPDSPDPRFRHLIR